MAEGFDFPNYFGGNSSALDDCMRDLSWFSEDEICIYFEHLESLKEKKWICITLYINHLNCIAHIGQPVKTKK